MIFGQIVREKILTERLGGFDKAKEVYNSLSLAVRALNEVQHGPSPAPELARLREWLGHCETLARMLGLTASEERKREERVFFFPPSGGYNHAFYDFFISRIEAAQRSILITGDGFGCADAPGRKLARRFDAAFRVALRRGVYVTRIQTTSNIGEYWGRLLRELVFDFPHLVRVYLPTQSEGANLASVCVIDQDAQDCVVELMLSSRMLLNHNHIADLASAAVFIEGESLLARDVSARIRALSATDVSVELDPTSNSPAKHGVLRYFAYGSNMDGAQMLERLGSEVRSLGIGFLENMKLVFNRKGSYRPGGVASVQSEAGSRVYGTIWEVSPGHLEIMDDIEDPDAYQRIRMTVMHDNGERLVCEVYQAFPEGDFQPDKEYLEKIIEAAEHSGLPTEYVKLLKGFRESRGSDE